MTQAFNLSQLANGVNTLGQLNAAANLYNQVTVANGGTNAASLTGNGALVMNSAGTTVTSVAAGASGNVLTSDGMTWASSANPASTNINIMTVATAPGTWTKPATVKSIKVTVVGGGGQGGPTQPTAAGNIEGGSGGGAGGAAIRFYPAASLPGPQPYTVGGAGATSSFGVAPITVISATAGAIGLRAAAGTITTVFGGAGGSGSNGNINFGGGDGATTNKDQGGNGGNSIFGGGGRSATTNAITAGSPGKAYGAGGGGSATGPATPALGAGAGAAGVVIIEEFY